MKKGFICLVIGQGVVSRLWGFVFLLTNLTMVPNAPASSVTLSDFDTMSGLYISGISDCIVSNGILCGTASDSDPRITMLDMSSSQYDTDIYSIVSIRAKISSNATSSARFYWNTTNDSGFSIERSYPFDTVKGEWVEYNLSLWDLPGWSGILDDIRIDLISGVADVGKEIEIDSVRLQTVGNPPKRALNPDLLVGAYYYWGFDAPSRLWQDGVPVDGNIYSNQWTNAKKLTQDYYDSNPRGRVVTPTGEGMDIICQDWEMKYMFATDEPFTEDWNYWVKTRQGVNLKLRYGHDFNWPDSLFLHEPVLASDGYLGYYSSSQTEVLEAQIHLAKKYGVDFFIFEAIMNYADSHIKAVAPSAVEAMKAAGNRNDVKFCIMWNNVDFYSTGTIDYSDSTLTNLMDYWVEEFVQESNYLKLDGKPVLYMLDIDGMLAVVGTQQAAAERLDFIREYMENEYGYNGMYIVGLGASRGDYSDCGFDAVTRYIYSRLSRDRDYAYTLGSLPVEWKIYRQNNTAVTMPTAQVSIPDLTWNNGSVIYTANQILNETAGGIGVETPPLLAGRGPSPNNFAIMLNRAVDFATNGPATSPIINIHAWNEWGVGCTIEPTQQFGKGMIEAIREYCGRDFCQNGSFEDAGLSPWILRSNGSAVAAANRVSVGPESSGCGNYNLCLSDLTTTWGTIQQTFSNVSYLAGNPMAAWTKIKTTDVAGNGASLRVVFRDSAGSYLDSFRSSYVAGTVSEYQTVSVEGVIPTNTSIVELQIVGSTTVPSGLGSTIEVDDVYFKTACASVDKYIWPVASIGCTTPDSNGNCLVSWDSADVETVQVFYRVNDGAEQLWQTGASGSCSFNVPPNGDTYIFSVYAGTNHVRRLAAASIVNE